MPKVTKFTLSLLQLFFLLTSAQQTLDAQSIVWSYPGLGEIRRIGAPRAKQLSIFKGRPWLAAIAVDIPNNVVFWSEMDEGVGLIKAGSLGGSGPVYSIAQTTGEVYGLTVDPVGKQIFFSEFFGRTVKRVNYDGTGGQVLIAGLNGPMGLALDATRGLLYVALNNSGQILRMNRDGLNPTVIATEEGPGGVAIDVSNNQLYWTSMTLGKVVASNLNGNNKTDIIANGLVGPLGLAIHTATRRIFVAEYNGDRVIEVPIAGVTDLSQAKIWVSRRRNVGSIALAPPIPVDPAAENSRVVFPPALGTPLPITNFPNPTPTILPDDPTGEDSLGLNEELPAAVDTATPTPQAVPTAEPATSPEPNATIEATPPDSTPTPEDVVTPEPAQASTPAVEETATSTDNPGLPTNTTPPLPPSSEPTSTPDPSSDTTKGDVINQDPSKENKGNGSPQDNGQDSSQSTSEERGEIRGSLLREDGSPIPHALLYLYRLPQTGNGKTEATAKELVESTTTDAQGFYLFANLPKGLYVVEPQLGTEISTPPVSPIVTPGQVVPPLVVKEKKKPEMASECQQTSNLDSIARANLSATKLAKFGLRKLSIAIRKLRLSKADKRKTKLLTRLRQQISKHQETIANLTTQLPPVSLECPEVVKCVRTELTDIVNSYRTSLNRLTRTVRTVLNPKRTGGLVVVGKNDKRRTSKLAKTATATISELPQAKIECE